MGVPSQHVPSQHEHDHSAIGHRHNKAVGTFSIVYDGMAVEPLAFGRCDGGGSAPCVLAGTPVLCALIDVPCVLSHVTCVLAAVPCS